MDFWHVLQMANYWVMEPPFNKLYEMRFFEKKVKKGMNMLPGMGNSTWAKMPEHIKKDIIKDYVRLNPGKTEADFLADRKSKVKERYAKRLADARKAKAEGN